MKKHSRALFFWTLAALFIIITPIVVFYARGYRFDFGRGIFVYSGIISVKSNPEKMDIYIDGKLKDSDINRINNSLNIKGLMPREYDLAIKADGFQDWSKKVSVHSGLATEFWNVILVKKEYERKEYQAPSIERMFISPKDDLLAYTENIEDGVKINILDIKKNVLENEFEIEGGNYNYQEKKENIEWSPEEDYLSVPLKLRSNPIDDDSSSIKDIYIILNPKEKTSFVLNDLLEIDEMKNVRWDPKNKNYLFFLSENSLYRANINEAEDLTLIAEEVSSFDLSHNGIYYAQMPRELVFKANLNGKGNREQITTDFPEELSTPNEKLIVYDESRMVFINQNEDFFIHNKTKEDMTFRKVAGNIKGIQFSNDGKKLLYWSENEISTYFLNDWEVQPIRSANDNVSLTRFSERIDNVQWHISYEHVIFNVGNQFKLIELDPRDKRNIMDFPQIELSSPIAVYNHDSKSLFFTDTKDGVNNLFSTVFPEKNTFLGL